MATANEKLQDLSLTHQVELQGYSNGVIRRMIALIKNVDDDLFIQLEKQLAKLSPSEFSVSRLDNLLKSVREINKEAYTELATRLDEELKDLAQYELDFQEKAMAASLPRQVPLLALNAERVYAAAIAQPFEGKLLKEWIQGLEVDKATRIRDAVRIGYVENETLGQIVKRIRGTKALNYKDGILEINRRNAESVVRTAIGHTAAFSRDRMFQENENIIKSLKWHSTLDGRTTIDICAPRDGKLYTLEHKPIGHSLSWHGGGGNAHFGCRSVMIPVLKSWRELGLDADELPPSTRASMDGQVPADITYGEWLAKKPFEFQQEVLGKTKAKLFRDGGLKIDRFSNNIGQEYTIQQLKTRDSIAFERAGL